MSPWKNRAIHRRGRCSVRWALVYTTPSHQFPLGMPMSLERRTALLDWASRHDAAIIEDDYDSEYRFTDRPLAPLQSHDRDGRVIDVGSFSKTLLPSLRLGFLVARRDLILDILRRDFADALDVVPSMAGLHLTAHLRPNATVTIPAMGLSAQNTSSGRTPSRSSQRIGYGAIREDRIAEGLRLLRDAIGVV